MEGFIKWIEERPMIVKILFCLIDVIYTVYRVFKCVLAKDFGRNFVYTIVLFILAWPCGLVIDLICVIKNGRPSTWFLE